jgi:hypothetical protein
MMSVSIKVDPIQWKGVREKLSVTPMWVLQIINRATEVAYEEAVKGAPEKTGELKSSIKIAYKGKTMGKVVATAKHAGSIDLGARPHVIIGNPLLRFEKGGQILFRRYVEHPGIKGVHFMEQAKEKAEREAEILVRTITKI